MGRRASRSISSKVPSSSRYSMRSRASILPRSCWRAIERSDPGWRAAAFFSSRSAIRSAIECWAMAPEVTDAPDGAPSPSW